MNDITKKLFELMKENPDLSILPLVEEFREDNGFAPSEDSLLSVEVSSYVIIDDEDGKSIYLKEIQSFLEEDFIREMEEHNENNLTLEEIKELAHERAEKLPWKKAIIIGIETYER